MNSWGYDGGEGREREVKMIARKRHARFSCLARWRDSLVSSRWRHTRRFLWDIFFVNAFVFPRKRINWDMSRGFFINLIAIEVLSFRKHQLSFELRLYTRQLIRRTNRSLVSHLGIRVQNKEFDSIKSTFFMWKTQISASQIIFINLSTMLQYVNYAFSCFCYRYVREISSLLQINRPVS